MAWQALLNVSTNRPPSPIIETLEILEGILTSRNTFRETPTRVSKTGTGMLLRDDLLITTATIVGIVIAITIANTCYYYCFDAYCPLGFYSSPPAQSWTFGDPVAH